MRRLFPLCLIACWILPFALSVNAQTEKATLFQKPTLSKTHIVFAYGGDLWIVPRQGGDAERLTTGVGVETDPCFSPDGSMVAFTGEYDGNVDVYVVPATGGVPKRLTYHPGGDSVAGWLPDGKSVLFRSTRTSTSGYTRLFIISLEGGFPSELPLHMAYEGSYSPDGGQIAYVPFPRANQIWKRYRGGRTTPIWIAKLSDSNIEKLPRENSTDFNPIWTAKKIFFLSDCNGYTTLFAYDLGTKKIAEAIKNSGLDLKSASAGPGAIVYEQFGTIHLYDLNSGKTQQVKINLAGDLSGVRARYEKVVSRVTGAAISPTGQRAAFEARGEIFTVPAEKGDVRNLSASPGVADRYPAWSPDGKWIASMCDESGEYQLFLRPQSGLGEVKKLTLGEAPSYYYSPVWSPDSKKIAYHDKRLNLWYIDIADGKSTKADTDYYDHPERSLDPNWAPDSKWIVYTKRLPSNLHAVFVFSLDTGKATQITDGMSDARYPVFDKNGKYIYFTASTDYALNTGWLDMSSIGRPTTRSVYLIVLKKDAPSPLAPESDEEKEEAAKIEKKESPSAAPAAGEAKPGEKKEGEKKEPVTAAIDFEGIGQRILALPIPARTYVGLAAGKTGVIFLGEAPAVSLPGVEGTTLHKFELEKRKVEKVFDGVTAFEISANGEKMLYRVGQDRWFIAGTAQPPKPGEGALRMDGMEMQVDPKAEWKQMYR